MEKILREIDEVRRRMNPDSAGTLEREIFAARRIFIAGAGRSGLLACTFAMRLLHLGFPVFVTGEVVTPAIAAGDLLLACSGSGITQTTLYFARVARRVGARVCVVTGRPRSPLCRLADSAIVIPTPARRTLGNSVFERTLFLFFEQSVERLNRKVKKKQAFRQVHANLE